MAARYRLAEYTGIPDNPSVTFCAAVKDLGVLIDSNLSYKAHIYITLPG